MRLVTVGSERLVLHALAVLLQVLSPTGNATAQSLPSTSRLHGAWSGAVRLEIPFRVVLHLRGDGPGLAGTIDFPDQNAKGLPLTEVRLQSDALHFRLAPASIRFDGRYDAPGDSISGTFAQGEQRFALTLRRASDSETSPPPRPQEPVPPLPYSAEEVRFAGGGAGIALAGTLTLPPGSGPHPAVLLLPGSGPLDRDAVVAGHRPSLVLADQLARQGFVVLRFDKRGVSRSGGVFADASLGDLASDAEAALTFLRSRPEVGAARVLLLGHSEGALLAGMLLARVPGLAGGILVGAPVQRGDSLMVSRARALLAARGVPPAILAKDAALRTAVFRAIERSATAAEARPAIRQALADALGQMTDAERAAVGYGEREWESGAEVFLDQLAWFKEWLSLDPADIYRRIAAPVLALYGALDQQVPAEPSAALIRRALSAAPGRRTEVIVLPGINHQMQEGRTGSPGEYGQISETIAAKVLERIILWARAAPYG
jgi:pimeloyl-ACP methyl ester carboxylesterase